jgi:pimeloyl-ACP methyl ester carboxylesterase
MGGTISTLIAATFPELVRKLVLVEGLGPLESTDTPPDRMLRWIHDVEERSRKPSKPMPSLEAAAARLRETNERLSDALSLFLVEKGTRRVEGGYVWAYDPLHRTRSPSPFSVDTYRTFLRQIACPTLLVEAAESMFPVMLEQDGRAGDIARLQRVRLEQAGHMIHHDQPAALAEVVGAFLNS